MLDEEEVQRRMEETDFEFNAPQYCDLRRLLVDPELGCEADEAAWFGEPRDAWFEREHPELEPLEEVRPPSPLMRVREAILSERFGRRVQSGSAAAAAASPPQLSARLQAILADGAISPEPVSMYSSPEAVQSTPGPLRSSARSRLRSGSARRGKLGSAIRTPARRLHFRTPSQSRTPQTSRIYGSTPVPITPSSKAGRLSTRKTPLTAGRTRRFTPLVQRGSEEQRLADALTAVVPEGNEDMLDVSNTSSVISSGVPKMAPLDEVDTDTSVNASATWLNSSMASNSSFASVSGGDEDDAANVSTEQPARKSRSMRAKRVKGGDLELDDDVLAMLDAHNKEKKAEQKLKRDSSKKRSKKRTAKPKKAAHRRSDSRREQLNRHLAKKKQQPAESDAVQRRRAKATTTKPPGRSKSRARPVQRRNSSARTNELLKQREQIQKGLRRRKGENSGGAANAPQVDDDVAAMLAEHNRSVQAQRSAYEPRKFSMGEIRAWEKRTGRFYYQMTPAERAQANVDIEAFVASGGGSEAPPRRVGLGVRLRGRS